MRVDSDRRVECLRPELWCPESSCQRHSAVTRRARCHSDRPQSRSDAVGSDAVGSEAVGSEAVGSDALGSKLPGKPPWLPNPGPPPPRFMPGGPPMPPPGPLRPLVPPRSRMAEPAAEIPTTETPANATAAITRATLPGDRQPLGPSAVASSRPFVYRTSRGLVDRSLVGGNRVDGFNVNPGDGSGDGSG